MCLPGGGSATPCHAQTWSRHLVPVACHNRAYGPAGDLDWAVDIFGLARLEADPFLPRPVRGILVAQPITPQARPLARPPGLVRPADGH